MRGSSVVGNTDGDSETATETCLKVMETYLSLKLPSTEKTVSKLGEADKIRMDKVDEDWTVVSLAVEGLGYLGRRLGEKIF